MTIPITQHNIRTPEAEELTLARDCADRLLCAARKYAANAESIGHENRFMEAARECVSAMHLLDDAAKLYAIISEHHERLARLDYDARLEEGHGI